jgi:ribose transport system permease protein
LALTEINTLLIGLGLSPAMVEAALGMLIVALVSIYGGEPRLSAVR